MGNSTRYIKEGRSMSLRRRNVRNLLVVPKKMW